ncbi:PREDICTED: 28S ribosomal protein S18c, mitochondrial isoform X2 [Haliaeetus leucocephalus]|uniref:28S ribosomal protein S18c, mitochondrial isoform X2 n=1 Tax=Haliaeetus leucocephalus TaxID=52644 RepID=UPI00053CC74B|nr:PREDICTED: 28S ribosomal protein S18c, mitochondrial isoform X2 [Haliaeetus leucocephalus]
MAGWAVAARGPWRRLVPAPLWEQPRRLQHEGRPSPSDQPIQMENPYKEPPKKCVLCGISVDYKNVQLLSQFVSPHTGCIYGRHITGLCNKKQKEITKAIKRAHVLGGKDDAAALTSSVRN